ncbi:MAG: NADH-quinone oxidoreductase subunit NuoB [Candidatus Parvarchaeota archaeon]|nr:NADH-quinone oxidoreductase subunit NuoB [Candidatus Rehaiarchaeum fermentans]
MKEITFEDFAKLEGGFLLTKAKELAHWLIKKGRSKSLWPLTFATSCCGIEMMSFGASKTDPDRAGILFIADSPRYADAIFVSGTITKKMANRLLVLYDQMPNPKYVIAVGACTISGGLYHHSYSVLLGIDKILPVDVYIHGCPPRPEQFLEAGLKLQELIKNDKIERYKGYI